MKTKIQYCKKCLYSSNHSFGITFNENGICSGCQVHEEKNTLDWIQRLQKLKELLKEYRSKRGNHDCIIHVDGSAESYYVTHIVKNILKMEPLLVNYNSHFNNNIGISNLANLRTKFNCDFEQFSLNLKTYKKLIKDSFFRYKHILWPYIAGKTSFPVRMTIKKKIPLIIWGGLQTIEQVGMFSHLDNVQMSRWHRQEHELFGIDEKIFTKNSTVLNDEDVASVKYPSNFDIKKNQTVGIYLSNYFKWDPWLQNKQMIKYGFKPEKHKRSFDPFEYSGCSVFMNIHDISKKIRSGYSKVIDQVSREIRFKRITRKQGEKIANYYSNSFPENIEHFFKFLEIDSNSQQWIKENFFNYNLKPNIKKITLNKQIKITTSTSPTKFFISYGKGIYL